MTKTGIISILTITLLFLALASPYYWFPGMQYEIYHVQKKYVIFDNGHYVVTKEFNGETRICEWDSKKDDPWHCNCIAPKILSVRVIGDRIYFTADQKTMGSRSLDKSWKQFATWTITYAIQEPWSKWQYAEDWADMPHYYTIVGKDLFYHSKPDFNKFPKSQQDIFQELELHPKIVVNGLIY